MLERQSTTVPKTSKVSAFTVAGIMDITSRGGCETGGLIDGLLSAADSEAVAVRILQRELAHAPGLGLDRLDDLGAALLILSIERVRIVDEDAEAWGLRLVLAGEKDPCVSVEDRAIAIAPRPRDLAAEDIAVIGLSPRHVGDGELGDDLTPHAVSPPSERTAQSRAGRLFCQGRAFSKAAAAWSTVRSAKRRPTLCRPTGSPALVKPAGMEQAGWPVKLKG